MLHRLLLIVLIALFPSFSAFAANSRMLTGVVTHVTDGDTLWVRSRGSDPGVQVRLQGLDAPEVCQAFGAQARDALAAHVLHKPVTVSIKARDVYRRSVGRVSLNGEDLGAWLVLNGYAWSTHYQRRAAPYARQEAAALGARRGLWASASPVEPRIFRKRHGSCH
ncbi:MAG: thermonuclease family protein [Pseudomonadota bacterium]